jgi:cytochrome b561
MEPEGVAALGHEGARYSRGAIWLHWIIAGLIVVNLTIGLLHDDFARPVRGVLMNWHKSIGFLVVALTLLRIVWRLTHRPPAMDPALRAWEAGLARTVHILFYVLLLAVPLSGWFMVSTGTRFNPIHFFWLFDIGPLPVTPGESAHETGEALHKWLGYGMIGLLALHVAGAVKHHLDGHRQIVGRMAPWLTGRSVVRDESA